MNALNIRTGQIHRFPQADDAKQAVRFAFLSEHPGKLDSLHTEFLRVEPRDGLGWAFGEWFAFTDPDPVYVLSLRAAARKIADEQAARVVITDRRQRRKARAGYLGKLKALRNRALASIFKSTADAIGVAL